jgi:hypothetical protein
VLDFYKFFFLKEEGLEAVAFNRLPTMFKITQFLSIYTLIFFKYTKMSLQDILIFLDLVIWILTLSFVSFRI